MELVNGPTFLGWMEEQGVPGFLNIKRAREEGSSVGDRHKRRKLPAAATGDGSASSSSAINVDPGAAGDPPSARADGSPDQQ